MTSTLQSYDIYGMPVNLETERGPLAQRADETLGPFALDRPQSQRDAVLIRLAYGVPEDPPAGLRLYCRGELADGVRLDYYCGESARYIRLVGCAGTHIDLATGKARITVTPGAEWGLELGGIVPALCAFLAQRDKHALHAACLTPEGANDAGAILLAGPSGSGKSTTALALAHEGMKLLTDDACFVGTVEGGAPAIWPLPRRCKVHEKTLELLPWLKRLPMHRAHTEKEWVLDPASPVESPRRARPELIVFLEPRNNSGHLVAPLDGIEALTRLTRENVRAFETDGEGAAGRAFAAMARLVRHSRTYRVSIGPRLENLRDALVTLFEKQSAR